MPFEVGTALRIFIMTLKPAIMEVRKRCKSQILMHVDDIPLLNLDSQMLRREILEIKNFLNSLGQLIAKDKSSVEPNQELTVASQNSWKAAQKTKQFEK
ncbi:MAG: hypothetical protein EZS28_001835 [Streblomastix strix]|uniref:Reverse transcriptase domain-containing protein n=1 Tax=Streblomastix strix TaxID=222440 RepID=A0A5J4X7C4_9EUKA|nr:MAG: hypothetical protein EZS28_001835 [Streblomastix strix]